MRSSTDLFIGLVNKTLKMSFFQDNFHFHNLSWVLDNDAKKRASLKEDFNWIYILKPRYQDRYCFFYPLLDSETSWTATCLFTRQDRV